MFSNLLYGYCFLSLQVQLESLTKINSNIKNNIRPSYNIHVHFNRKAVEIREGILDIKKRLIEHCMTNDIGTYCLHASY